LKNSLEIHCCVVSNENSKSIHVDVEREERQCILLQMRIKVVKHELLFITLIKI